MSFLTKLPRGRYSSDAFAHFDADREDFNFEVARAMAWMSQFAYETDEPTKVAEIAAEWRIIIPHDGIISEEVATPLPKTSTQVIVGNRDSATIIAFAGTDPLVLADWITDFDLGITNTGTANGFAAAAEAVWPKIRAFVQGAQARSPFLITGHSLGGALAVLTADRINALRPGSVRAVYTFGMPRAGDLEFATSYNQALGYRTYRLVHGDDVVPTVAPSFLGLRHVGRHIHCSRGGRFEDRALAQTIGSDEPQFEKGVSKQLHGLLHGPLSSAMSVTARLKIASALALGIGPAGMRTDPGGLVIELLPPPLRDHMPDRYIHAV
jgi:triacylglycerol lipase